MIRETRDASVLNWFSHHPDIVDGIGGTLDFSGAANRPSNLFLFGDHGGFLFEWTSPGTYEVHVMLTRAGRGTWGFTAALQARDMIEARGARALWARVPDDRPDLAYFTRKAGFREVERRTLYPGPHEWRIFEWRSERCPQQ